MMTKRLTLLSCALLTVGLAAERSYSESGMTPQAAAIQEHAQMESGRDLYLRYCATCHGNSGASDGSSAKNMKKKPRKLNGSEPFKLGKTAEGIYQAITVGIPKTAMTSFDHLPEVERRAIASFVEAMANPQKPPKAAQKGPSKAKKTE